MLQPTSHRRGKRDKTSSCASDPTSSHRQQDGRQEHKNRLAPPLTRRKSKAFEKHGRDAPSGGIESLFPSLIGVAILACGVMAKMGFRGRASVAGIDLGTTNSVICVQAQAKGVGKIDCIPDPATGSPIVPSVVSFLEPWERKVGPSSKIPSMLQPHPSHVVVGQTAKRRIDSHPHHTLYNAKRVLGRPFDDSAVSDLAAEVEFRVRHDAASGEAAFSVPDSLEPIKPQQVGSYVVHHLVQMTKQYLGHDNVKSAVICVPAKFDADQRRRTVEAFRHAGISVARVVEEPTAAALAYGLHLKRGVDYILVYDFGGGTLDVSLLRVTDGFVDVMGSDGDDRLGGADFDTAVANFLLQERGGQEVVERTNRQVQVLSKGLPEGEDLEDKLAAACPPLSQTPLCSLSSFHSLGEQMKIGLSSYPDKNGEVAAGCLATPPAGIPDEAEFSIASFCDSLSEVTLTLTSREYDMVVQPLLQRSVIPIRTLLSDLGLQESDVDEVVMVGGTTRMPQIRALVKAALPSSEVNTHIDPDITVAYGAASVID